MRTNYGPEKDENGNICRDENNKQISGYKRFCILNKIEPVKKKINNHRFMNSNAVDKLYNSATANEKALIELLMLTGARPSEVAKGIEILVKDDEVHIQIKRAKQKADKESYTFLIYKSKDVEDFFDGSELLSKAPLNTSTIWKSERTIQRKLNKAGVRANMNNPFTVYNFRNQFKSNLEKEVSREKVSYAMGHRNIETQRCYGHWNSSNGFKLSPTDIQANYEVRGNVSRGWQKCSKESKPQLKTEASSIFTPLSNS